MAISVIMNNATYEVPTGGNVNWASLTQFLAAIPAAIAAGGGGSSVATASAVGTVKLSSESQTPLAPVVMSDSGGSMISAGSAPVLTLTGPGSAGVSTLVVSNECADATGTGAAVEGNTIGSGPAIRGTAATGDEPGSEGSVGLEGRGSTTGAPARLVPQEVAPTYSDVGALYVDSSGVLYICTAAGNTGEGQVWTAVGSAASGGTTYTHTSPTDEEYAVATVTVPRGSVIQLTLTVIANVDQEGPTRGEPGGAFSGSLCEVSTWHNTFGTTQGLGSNVVLWNQTARPGVDWNAYMDIVGGALSVILVNSSGNMLVDWTATVETKVLAALG